MGKYLNIVKKMELQKICPDCKSKLIFCEDSGPTQFKLTCFNCNKSMIITITDDGVVLSDGMTKVRKEK